MKIFYVLFYIHPSPPLLILTIPSSRYFDSSAPYYRPALGVVIGLMLMSGICAVILRFLLQYQNRQLARMENEDAELTNADMAKLRKTADFEGIDIATARQLQKGYRYMI